MWDPICVILLRHGMTFSFTQKAHKSSENWFCDKTALVFIVGGPWFKARKALPIFQTNLRIYCQGWYETCRGVNRKYLLLLKGGERWQNFLPDHFVFKKDSTSPYKGTTSLHTVGKMPGNSPSKHSLPIPFTLSTEGAQPKLSDTLQNSFNSLTSEDKGIVIEGIGGYIFDCF